MIVDFHTHIGNPSFFVPAHEMLKSTKVMQGFNQILSTDDPDKWLTMPLKPDDFGQVCAVGAKSVV